VGEEAGSKADKARTLGVTMLDEAAFKALIAQNTEGGRLSSAQSHEPKSL